MDIHWSVSSSSRRGGDGVKCVDLDYSYFSQLGVHEDLVQHPSKYISIIDG